MAKITRPNTSFRGFAESSANGERTVFRVEQVTDNLTINLNQEYTRGFGLYGAEEVPEITDFNAFGFTMNRLTAYLFQQGVPEWDAAQEYYEDQKCQVNGVIYVSNTNDNVGNNPAEVLGNPSWVNTSNAVFPCQGRVAGASGSENTLTFICSQSEMAYTYRIENDFISLVNPQGSPIEFDQADEVKVLSIGTSQETDLETGSLGVRFDLIQSTNGNAVIFLNSQGVLRKVDKDSQGKFLPSVEFATLPETSSGIRDYILMPLSGSDFLAYGRQNGDTYYIDYNSESVSQTSTAGLPINLNITSGIRDKFSLETSLFANNFLYIMGSENNRIYRNTTQGNYSSFNEIIVEISSVELSPVEMIEFDGSFYISCVNPSTTRPLLVSTTDFLNFSEVATPYPTSAIVNNQVLSIKNAVNGIFLVMLNQTTVYYSQDPYNPSSYSNVFTLQTSGGLRPIRITGAESQIATYSAIGGSRTFRLIDSEGNLVLSSQFNSSDGSQLRSIIVNNDGQEIITVRDQAGGGVSIQRPALISGGSIGLSVCFSTPTRMFTAINGFVRAYNVNNATGEAVRVGNALQLDDFTSDVDICAVSSPNLPLNSSRDYILVYTGGNGEINAYRFDGQNFVFYGLVYTAQNTGSDSQIVQLRRQGGEVVFNDRSASEFVKISVGSGGVFGVDAIVSNSDDLSNPRITKAAEARFAAINSDGSQVITYDFSGVTAQVVAPEMDIASNVDSNFDAVQINALSRAIKSDQSSQIRLFSLKETPVQSEFWRFLEFSGATFDGSKVGLQSTNVEDAIKEILTSKRYPVGSIYHNINLVDPSEVLGFGTWVRMQGVFIVGHDASDSDFNNVNVSGGSKTHTHSYGVGAANAVIPHPRDGWGSVQQNGALPEPSFEGTLVVGSGFNERAESLESLSHANRNRQSVISHSHLDNVTQEESSLPEYVVFYLWRRVS